MRLRLNIPYILFCGAAVTIVLAFIGYTMTSQIYAQWSQGLPITGGLSWPIVIGVDLICCSGILAVYWKIYADANTAISSSGINRPSLLGPKYIAWSDVTEIQVVNGFGFHVLAGTRKIIITPYAYHEPEQVIEMLGQYYSQGSGNHAP